MLIKEWQDLPDNMKNKEVKWYYDKLKKKKSCLILKRVFDIVMASFLIILLSPIILIISICIKLDTKGPVFYRQERITQYGKIFRIFKFRTMIVDADKVGSLVTLSNDTRITHVGNKIRKLRLDELPQLINIFKGDMSFVGTRPEVKKYVESYSSEMMATLLMPAGVTSISSIKFKDEDEYLDKFKEKHNNKIDDIYIHEILSIKMKYNLEYIVNFNFISDIKICFKTVLEVLK